MMLTYTVPFQTHGIFHAILVHPEFSGHQKDLPYRAGEHAIALASLEPS